MLNSHYPILHRTKSDSRAETPIYIAVGEAALHAPAQHQLRHRQKLKQPTTAKAYDNFGFVISDFGYGLNNSKYSLQFKITKTGIYQVSDPDSYRDKITNPKSHFTHSGG